MKSKSMIRAVLFDVGWTLIYPKPTRKEAVENYLLSLGYTFPPDVLESAYSSVANYYRIRRWQPQAVANIAQFWQSYYMIYIEHLGLEDPGISLAINAHASKSVQYYIYPGTLAVLQELHKSGYLIGAVSNWSAELRDILTNLRLNEFLDTTIVSDIVGYHKPQPEIFRIALMSLGVRASEAVHVGDDIEADIDGARQAGIRPIWLDRGKAENTNPPYRIRSLDELISLLL